MSQHMLTLELLIARISQEKYALLLASLGGDGTHPVLVRGAGTLQRSSKRVQLQAIDQDFASFTGSIGLKDRDDLIRLAELDSDDATPLTRFAVFRHGDARTMLMDAAWNWISKNILPDYDMPAIEVENDHFIVMANGVASNPRDSRGASGASSARQRPRKACKIKHAWF